MDVTTVVKGQDLFRVLTPEEIARTDRFSAVKKFARGESIYRCETPATHFFVLLKGRAHLRLPTGVGEVSMVVSKVEAGSLLGLAALVGPERYSATAYCDDPCEVLAIEVRPFRELLHDNPRLGAQVMAAVARSYCDRYLVVLHHLQKVFNQLPLLP